MVGPLALHRFLFLLLNGILIYRIGKRLLMESEGDPVEEMFESKDEMDWRDAYLKEPPPLRSSLAERMRLNELLAAKNYDCRERLQLGDGNEKYVLCGEFGPFMSAASISGDKAATGDLEKQIAAQNWIIFTPEGSQIVDKLTGDVEVNYLTELEEWDHWHTWDFEQVLKDRQLDVAKFELYSPHFGSQDQPDVLRKLVPLMQVRQLLLTVEPGDSVVWRWYRLLYWLFFEHGYVLVGAVPNGICGAVSRRCRYRITLAKIPEEQIKSVPVFGLGSPTEEKLRLVHFIKGSQDTCKEATLSTHFPSFCLWNIQENDTVVVVNYDGLNRDTIPKELEKLKSITVVSTRQLIDTNNIRHLPWTLSSLNGTDNYGRVKTLDDVLLAVGGQIDLVLLAVDGAEWELLPQLLSSAPHIQQIAIRGRLFPEENENYRLFYWQLHRLTRLGFNAKMGRYKEPYFSIVLKKN